MPDRILINATEPEELRVAIVSKDQQLSDFDYEHQDTLQSTGNIYYAQVKNLEISLGAAFLEYTKDKEKRHGFLPMKEIAPEYFSHLPEQDGRYSIKDVLKVGQPIVVQVAKDQRDSKGAALTTYLDLASSFFVLKPNNPKAKGISRRITGEDRDNIKTLIDELNIPEGMGIIVRTAGLGRDIETLRWDLQILLNQYHAIQNIAQKHNPPFLIHQESDIIVRALRDYLRPNIDEILVDTKECFEKAKDYLSYTRPDFIKKLKLYQNNIPLFTRYQIESQIASAFEREVKLDNGGSIVIDPTEALVSIDINSSKATSGSSIEETAFQTNLAAAEEIARQLRIRDMGGLFCIDFIDMTQARHQREVENALKEATKLDRARIQIGRISRFGLLEMSRQRLRASLNEAIQEECPRCSGQGRIRTTNSLSLSLLRIIEENAMKPNTKQIRVRVPLPVGTYLLNEKHATLDAIKQQHNVDIFILPSQHLETPHYTLERLKQSDNSTLSYNIIDAPTQEEHYEQPSKPVEKPALQSMSALDHQPLRQEATLVKKLWSAVFGNNNKKNTPLPEVNSNTDIKDNTDEQPSGSENMNRGRRHGNQNRRTRKSTTAPRQHNHQSRSPAASHQMSPEEQMALKEERLMAQMKEDIGGHGYSNPKYNHGSANQSHSNQNAAPARRRKPSAQPQQQKNKPQKPKQGLVIEIEQPNATAAPATTQTRDNQSMTDTATTSEKSTQQTGDDAQAAPQHRRRGRARQFRGRGGNHARRQTTTTENSAENVSNTAPQNEAPAPTPAVKAPSKASAPVAAAEKTTAPAVAKKAPAAAKPAAKTTTTTTAPAEAKAAPAQKKPAPRKTTLKRSTAKQVKTVKKEAPAASAKDSTPAVNSPAPTATKADAPKSSTPARATRRAPSKAPKLKQVLTKKTAEQTSE